MLRPYLVVRIASAKFAFLAGLGLAPAVGAFHAPVTAPSVISQTDDSSLSLDRIAPLPPH
jgi:hypothetical protein